MPSNAATLGEIADALGADTHAARVAVVDVHHDSRRVTPGSVFVAIPGDRADGHDFAAGAAADGAAALIVERELDVPVPQIVVDDARAALAVAAAIVHHRPSAAMTMVGVTGTNGKTTVTQMVDAIAHQSGLTSGVIGTLGARVGETEMPIAHTTPEASDLQRILAEMRDLGATHVAMEVSSHALVLHRADEIRFDVAAFTNLSQDHLDFHGDLDSYFAAKAKLFDAARSEHAVVFVDDEAGARLADSVSIDVTRVSLARPAEVYATGIDTRGDGNRFTLVADGESALIDMPLPAAFNVENALVAAAIGLRIGLSFGEVADGLAALPQVPGRFEAVHGEWPFDIVVDYAHTPEAVAAAVAEARSLTSGRVIALVGAGGDRDEDKRPLMGRAASGADVAVITSDNPRSEPPAAIIDSVVAGADGGADVVVEQDRRAAIRAAFLAAGAGDIVLILGKGHEQGQDFGGGRVEPFDDRVVAREEAGAFRVEVS